MELYDLKTEYRVNPIGLTVRNPRFSWKIRAEEKNTRQKSCRITVTSCGKTVWDAEYETEESVLVPYAGEPLVPETLYPCENRGDG